jgi:hypothetical protein
VEEEPSKHEWSEACYPCLRAHKLTSLVERCLRGELPAFCDCCLLFQAFKLLHVLSSSGGGNLCFCLRGLSVSIQNQQWHRPHNSRCVRSSEALSPLSGLLSSCDWGLSLRKHGFCTAFNVSQPDNKKSHPFIIRLRLDTKTKHPCVII